MLRRSEKRREEAKHVKLYNRLSGVCRRYIAKPILTQHETITAQIALGPTSSTHKNRQVKQGKTIKGVFEQKMMTLHKYIHGEFNTPTIRSFFVKQLARALICFHNVGALHNDVKFNNTVVSFTIDKTRLESLDYTRASSQNEKIRILDLCIKTPRLYLIDLGMTKFTTFRNPLFGYDATNENFLKANALTAYENPENAFLNRHAVRPIRSNLPQSEQGRKIYITDQLQILHAGLTPENHLPVVYMRLLRDQAKRYAAKFLERVRSSKKASNATKEAVERTVATLLQGA
eukprot:1770159-Pleurochrysis_carterae.AAC.1